MSDVRAVLAQYIDDGVTIDLLLSESRLVIKRTRCAFCMEPAVGYWQDREDVTVRFFRCERHRADPVLLPSWTGADLWVPV